jgi:hypothetical protein
MSTFRVATITADHPRGVESLHELTKALLSAMPHQIDGRIWYALRIMEMGIAERVA